VRGFRRGSGPVFAPPSRWRRVRPVALWALLLTLALAFLAWTVLGILGDEGGPSRSTDDSAAPVAELDDEGEQVVKL